MSLLNIKLPGLLPRVEYSAGLMACIGMDKAGAIGYSGWRVASRTLGQGFKTLRIQIAPRIHGWELRPHMSNQGTLECKYWEPPLIPPNPHWTVHP